VSTGNYRASNAYDSKPPNLQTLLTNLVSSAVNSSSNVGFAKRIIDHVPNKIMGLVL
jgi:hypothetical protein